MTATRFTVHQDVAIVEHDPATRQPLEGGDVYYASISGVSTLWVTASYGKDAAVRSPYLFDVPSGWDAVTRGYRWRLVPVCRCENPILGEPVTDPGDPTGEEFCGPDCVTTAAESSHGAFAARERD